MEFVYSIRVDCVTEVHQLNTAEDDRNKHTKRLFHLEVSRISYENCRISALCEFKNILNFPNYSRQ